MSTLFYPEPILIVWTTDKSSELFGKFMKITAIILASGSGERFCDNKPKQFTKLAGLPILVHTLKAFESFSDVHEILVVTGHEFIEHVWELVGKYSLNKVSKVVSGGATRQESSSIGLQACDAGTDYVLIHDGVRPFVSHQVLERLVSAVQIHAAVDTVIPSADTLVQINDAGFIDNIPDRSCFRRGQTPQAFSLSLIQEAHRQAQLGAIWNATDDCALVMRLGHPVYVVAGDEQNIKITYPLDLHLADKLFQLNMQLPSRVDGWEKILRDRVFVVVGGMSGIGAAIVSLLRSHYSASVYALGRQTSPSVDVTDYGTVVNAVGEIFRAEGHIDYVINCAGDLIRKNVANMGLEEWDYIYRLNVTANFFLAKALIPIWQKQNFGNLMMVGSSSYTRGRGGYAAYSSSKAALVNFCQALAEEVDCWKVKVNVASPGRVSTDLRYRNFGKEPPGTLLNPEHVAKEIVSALTMGTTGSVFEIS